MGFHPLFLIIWKSISKEVLVNYWGFMSWCHIVLINIGISSVSLL